MPVLRVSRSAGCFICRDPCEGVSICARPKAHRAGGEVDVICEVVPRSWSPIKFDLWLGLNAPREPRRVGGDANLEFREVGLEEEYLMLVCCVGTSGESKRWVK